MSKSVLNSNFLTKEEVPPYEESLRQQKKQRRVNRFQFLELKKIIISFGYKIG